MQSYLESIMNQQLPMIRFESFDQMPFFVHGFTTRLGGVSEGIFSSLNLSFTRGDDRNKVLTNYRRIAEVMKIDIDHFVASDQTHTTNIRIVDKADAGKGIIREKDYTDIDGLMTDQAGLLLFTYFADCVPLFFADPVRKVVAVSHSGWKGTLGRMGQKTINKMEQVYGCKPQDIRCAIGPSICQDCYEVSEELYEAFQTSFSVGQMKQLFMPKSGGKYQLDLWKANEIILREAGILENHLENRRICTCCHKEILFSHRGSQGKRGNLAAMIGIR